MNATPPEITEQMLTKVRVRKNDHILEPSAGNGSMAKVIQQHYPDNPLWVIEKNLELAFSLVLQGFRLLTDDFLKFYDRFDIIIMSPPFMMNYQDIDHFRHAWDCLKSGGRIVSLMHGYSVFSKATRSSYKVELFNDWIASVGISCEHLPDNSLAPTRVAIIWGTKP